VNQYTVKPVRNGTMSDGNFSFSKRFLLIQVLESWIIGAPDRDFETFPLKTGFCYALVPFKEVLLYL